MNNKDIQLAIQENFEIGVDKVFQGKIEQWKGKFVTPEMSENSLKNTGFVSQEDVDTNGWMWDRWETWKKEGKFFIFTFCGHNGNCSFELSDEE